jgi:ATP-dependent 26S proteasome regulatory subunit
VGSTHETEISYVKPRREYVAGETSVNVLELATRSDTLCGRDIKNAVIDTAIRVTRQSRYAVRQLDLLGAVDRVFCPGGR